MSGNLNGNIALDFLEIKDVIDINLLQIFQDNFAQSMDIASVTVDRNGVPVTKTSCYTSYCTDFVHATQLGDSRCAKSHKKGGEEAAKIGKPYIYTCHAGLIDFAAPILVEGRQIGTILGGQVLTQMPAAETYVKIAEEIGADGEKLFEAARKIKVITKKKVEAAAEVLFIVANALSKIGYEELKLKQISYNLEKEVVKKNILLEESNEHNKLKTQLFSIMSHELKTPVNIIYSSLQLLESLGKQDNIFAQDPEIFLKYSKMMKQNCFRLIKLTNNIIDLNKMELGYYSIQLKNDNIVKVIEDITLSVVEYVNSKNINLIFDTEIEEKIMAFDSEKLERILLNLLSNSIKFTEPGGSIYVNIQDAEQYIIITVKDTGIGIPKNMIEKIFETFTQVDDSFRRNAEGSGIGLAIVKALVKMHGGDIKVRSQVGFGSEFIIKLPVKFVYSDPSTNKNGEININSNMERTKIEFSDIYL